MPIFRTKKGKIKQRLAGNSAQNKSNSHATPNQDLHDLINLARVQEERGRKLLRSGKRLAMGSAAVAGMGGELPAGIGLGVGLRNAARGHMETTEARQKRATAERVLVERRLGISETQRIRQRLGLDQQNNLRNRRKMRRVRQ